MGREVKRVALDFQWPLDEIWKGYLNPHYSKCHQCPACKGAGVNPATKQLQEDWYDSDRTGRKWCHALTQDEVDALVKEGRLNDLTSKWDGKKWEKVRDVTAQEVNTWAQKQFLGHDAINRLICVETRAKRLGVWGDCPMCRGEGSLWETPEDKVKSDTWEETHPPAGEGWQLWETVSEGSPISPVFDTPEKLAQWLAAGGVGKWRMNQTTYDQWLKMITVGWCPSAMTVNGKFIEGEKIADFDSKQ